MLRRACLCELLALELERSGSVCLFPLDETGCYSLQLARYMVFVGQLVCVRDEQAPGAISKAAASVQGLGPCVKWSNTLAFCMRGIDWWLRRRALVRRQRQQP